MKTPEKIEQALDKKKKKKKKKRNIFSYFSKDMCSPLTYGISLEISPVLHEEIGRRKNKIFLFLIGVVGWCEGAVYLTSLGRPTDIGLQLGKACYPCSG